jgi:hypothetical protein
LENEMDREIKPYVLRRTEDDTPSKLSLDYAQALNAQQLAAGTVLRSSLQERGAEKPERSSIAWPI